MTDSKSACDCGHEREEHETRISVLTQRWEDRCLKCLCICFTPAPPAAPKAVLCAHTSTNYATRHVGAVSAHLSIYCSKCGVWLKHFRPNGGKKCSCTHAVPSYADRFDEKKEEKQMNEVYVDPNDPEKGYGPCERPGCGHKHSRHRKASSGQHGPTPTVCVDEAGGLLDCVCAEPYNPPKGSTHERAHVTDGKTPCWCDPTIESFHGEDARSRAARLGTVLGAAAGEQINLVNENAELRELLRRICAADMTGDEVARNEATGEAALYLRGLRRG